MYYEITGTGPIKLVFINGVGGNLNGWEFQISYFGNLPDYTVCAFDNRGAGLSDTVAFQRNTTKEMAQDSLELLEEIGWTKNINLVAVSMGGMIALELALLKPEMFATLVLTSTTSGRSLIPLYGLINLPRTLINKPEKSIEILAGVLFPQSFLESEAPADFVPLLIPTKEKYTQRDVFWETMARRSTKSRAATLKGYLLQVGAILTHHVSKERLHILRDSGIEILVVTGTEDNLVKPENSEYLAKNLNAKLIVFEDAGHNPHNQLQKDYNDLLEEFIFESFKKKNIKIPFFIANN
ncbi:hypothetical protein HDU92_007921 [Lobulomyces angularis]|nr:hypothetical protein HDU92_007921 [Lobulomyces angularis]